MKTMDVKSRLIGLFAALILSIGTAQATPADDAKTIAAFTLSYTHEYAGKYADAIKAMKEVYDENSYEINLRLGWLTYAAGSFTESSTYYQKAMKLKPYSVEAKLGYVNPEAALGSWDKVLAQYQEILKIDAQNSTANYRIGNIYYARKKYDEAQKHFEKVVNLYPFDYSSLLMLGWTKLQLGNGTEAKVLFNKVLMYSPSDTSAKEGLALIK